jgi:hypothetical protein
MKETRGRKISVGIHGRRHLHSLERNGMTPLAREEGKAATLQLSVPVATAGRAACLFHPWPVLWRRLCWIIRHNFHD